MEFNKEEIKGMLIELGVVFCFVAIILIASAVIMM